MSLYTFRKIYDGTVSTIFECCKWDDHKEPVDVYEIRASAKTGKVNSCGCFAKGPCKHMACVQQIIDSNSIDDLHLLTWSYENEWVPIRDMEYA